MTVKCRGSSGREGQNPVSAQVGNSDNPGGERWEPERSVSQADGNKPAKSDAGLDWGSGRGKAKEGQREELGARGFWLRTEAPGSGRWCDAVNTLSGIRRGR